MGGFQEVYGQQAKAVYRFLMALTRDEAMAEELLQETFYQAFLHIDRFEGRCSLYTWLCQIGKNAWFRECKRWKLYADAPPETLKIPDSAPGPEAQAIMNEDWRRVRRAILALEEPYRDVFILHAYAGLKLKEIALNYGKSESWARVTYFRARRKIIQEVSE